MGAAGRSGTFGHLPRQLDPLAEHPLRDIERLFEQFDLSRQQLASAKDMADMAAELTFDPAPIFRNALLQSGQVNADGRSGFCSGSGRRLDGICSGSEISSPDKRASKPGSSTPLTR